jgi:hypothetical protein
LNKVWVDGGDELALPPYLEKQGEEERDVQSSQASDMSESAALVDKEPEDATSSEEVAVGPEDTAQQ